MKEVDTTMKVCELNRIKLNLTTNRGVKHQSHQIKIAIEDASDRAKENAK
jgi:hypothetical protein